MSALWSFSSFVQPGIPDLEILGVRTSALYWKDPRRKDMKSFWWVALVLMLCSPVYSGELEYELSTAVVEEDSAKVKEILQKGVNLNYQNGTGITVLMESSKMGIAPLVELFLANGANVNLQDKTGMTALMQAASKGKDQVVKVLLDKGADVNLKSKTGATALTFATVGKHAKVIELLKSKGAQ
jgi:hypothetical protein